MTATEPTPLTWPSLQNRMLRSRLALEKNPRDFQKTIILHRDVVGESPRLKRAVEEVVELLPEEVFSAVFIRHRTLIILNGPADPSCALRVEEHPPDWIIVLRARADLYEETWTFAHEVAHAYLRHADIPVEDVPRIEYEANALAQHWGFIKQ